MFSGGVGLSRRGPPTLAGIIATSLAIPIGIIAIILSLHFHLPLLHQYIIIAIACMFPIHIFLEIVLSRGLKRGDWYEYWLDERVRKIIDYVAETEDLVDEIKDLVSELDVSNLSEEEIGWFKVEVPDYIERAKDKLRLIRRLVIEGFEGRGRVRLKVRRVNVRDIIELSIKRMQKELRFRKKNISIEGSAFIRTNPELLRSIFKNLISNAIKYTGDEQGFGGNIRINIEQRDDGKATVTVSDDGIGMESENLEDIFEHGFIVEGAQPAAGMPRSGEGLYFARKWAELLGGTLTAESQGLGKGSSFRAELPFQHDIRATDLEEIVADYRHDVRAKITGIRLTISTIEDLEKELPRLSSQQKDIFGQIKDKCNEIVRNLEELRRLIERLIEQLKSGVKPPRVVPVSVRGPSIFLNEEIESRLDGIITSATSQNYERKLRELGNYINSLDRRFEKVVRRNPYFILPAYREMALERLLKLIEVKLGPAPCRYAAIVLAAKDKHLLSDVDVKVIVEERSDYFERFGDELRRAGEEVALYLDQLSIEDMNVLINFINANIDKPLFRIILAGLINMRFGGGNRELFNSFREAIAKVVFGPKMVKALLTNFRLLGVHRSYNPQEIGDGYYDIGMAFKVVKFLASLYKANYVGEYPQLKDRQGALEIFAFLNEIGEITQEEFELLSEAFSFELATLKLTEIKGPPSGSFTLKDIPVIARRLGISVEEFNELLAGYTSGVNRLASQIVEKLENSPTSGPPESSADSSKGTSKPDAASNPGERENSQPPNIKDNGGGAVLSWLITLGAFLGFGPAAHAAGNVAGGIALFHSPIGWIIGGVLVASIGGLAIYRWAPFVRSGLREAQIILPRALDLRVMREIPKPAGRGRRFMGAILPQEQESGELRMSWLGPQEGLSEEEVMRLRELAEELRKGEVIPQLLAKEDRYGGTPGLEWISPEEMEGEVEGIKELVREVRRRGYKSVVVIGEGTGPYARMAATIAGKRRGSPRVYAVEHQQAAREIEREINPEETLFIVSSPEGAYKHFYGMLTEFHRKRGFSIGEIASKVGEHFVAIVEANTPFAEEARERKFLKTFNVPQGILVPLALAGVNIEGFLESAKMGKAMCREENPEKNLGAQLAIFQEAMRRAGRSQLVLVLPEELRGFGQWWQELISSPVREGEGIIPIVEEELASPESYSKNTAFIVINLNGLLESSRKGGITLLSQGLQRGGRSPFRVTAQLKEAGYPVFEISLSGKEGIGALFYVTQFANELSRYLMGISPSKSTMALSQQTLENVAETTRLQEGMPPAEPLRGEAVGSRYVVSGEGMMLYYGSLIGKEISEQELEEVLKLIGRRDIAGVYGAIMWLAKKRGVEYAGLLPFVYNGEKVWKDWRRMVRGSLGMGTVVGKSSGLEKLYSEGPEGILTLVSEKGWEEVREAEERLSEAGRMSLRIEVERMDRRGLKGLERIFAETGEVLKKLEGVAAPIYRSEEISPAKAVGHQSEVAKSEPLSEYPVKPEPFQGKVTGVVAVDMDALFDIEPVREATPSRMNIELKVKLKSKGVFNLMGRIASVAKEEGNLGRLKFAFISNRRDVSRKVMEQMLRDYMSAYGLSAEVIASVVDGDLIIDERALREAGGIVGIMSRKISARAVFAIINERLVGMTDGNGTEIRIITDTIDRWEKDGTRKMVERILWVVLNPAKEGEVLSTTAGLVVAIEGKVSDWLIDFIRARYPEEEAARLLPQISKDGTIILPATPVDEKYLEGMKAEERIYKVQA